MEDTQIINLERKINIDCESDCTVVYVDVRLDNEMFNLISRSIAGAGLSAGGQVSRTCKLWTNLCSEDNLAPLSPSHPSSTGTVPAGPGRG